MLAVQYESPLVLISILVAIFAAYTALSLADRVKHTDGAAARWWIAGGAMAMGMGIWSMHFVGMLAFRLPLAIGYDLVWTLLSLTLAILSSWLALWQVSQPELPTRRLLSGAILMGSGITAMHYSGMTAMRMQPDIVYDYTLVFASAVVAVLASGGALWLSFVLQRRIRHVHALRGLAAVVMGSAIVGMHYIAMAAASFSMGSICLAARDGFNQNTVASLVIVTTFAVLSIALLTAVFDARLESGARVLAMSEATSEERQTLLKRERSARQQAERMNVLKDEFLATLSHELRTPLSAILGWSQILRGTAKGEPTLLKGLDTIERNARAQAKLIDDLLDMSKIISGKISVDMQQVSPVAFIAAAVETIRPAAIAKHITLENVLDSSAGMVSGDMNRLQQVMWNLLSNAVKFTPKDGRIKVVLEQDSHEIIVKVIDSGIGIDPAFLPHVFDRFRQADASTTRRYGGLGLGLAIVKQLVELHGGWIRAESEGQNAGTSFILGLPLCLPMANHQVKDVANCSQSLADLIDFEPIDLSGVTVLAVDDEPDALELVRQILAACGATTITATNALDGLALAQSMRPDVIVSDIGMPDMDGFELVRRIRMRGSQAGGNVAVIALTAFTRSEDREKASQAGFNAFLTKPIEPSDLTGAVYGMMSARRVLDRQSR